ncbi:aminodeoxychorismate synthase component I [Microlunatus sp. Y2014]|uniref:aminodeoxychorismate synthase component I n=1 Tax=Microlunatus sp. Y2014 TaxID=3418488 RepID=UPI003DA75C2D
MTGSSGPSARFDDLVDGVSWLFEQPHRVVVARTTDEVVPALEAVATASEQGRWAAGYVAYDAAAAFDPGLVTAATDSAHTDPAGMPLVWFMIGGPPTDPQSLPTSVAPLAGARQLAWTSAEHGAAVDAVRAAIAAGETYQCNLTTRLQVDRTAAPAELYAHLATGQRGRYNALMDLGDVSDHAVVSASPEGFFEWRGDRLVCEPMKGTIARGASVAADRARRDQLISSRKDRAENLMIVDLVRNDLSRICRPGTVEVSDLFACRRFPTVWQLTSTVSGRLAGDTDLVDVFTALFPSGSVTGAPKARTMELITELEPSPRGVYCGAIGWVAPADRPVRARFSVAIRTAVVGRSTGRATYGVGGGITWGSTPAGEWEEVLAKTAVWDHRPTDWDLLETMGARDGMVVDLDRHLARLAASADHFDRPVDLTELRERLADVHPWPRARVRVQLGPTGGFTIKSTVAPDPDTAPVRLVVDELPVDPDSPWLHHKTTNRQLYEDARTRHRIGHGGADDVVLINDHGHVTETTIANLVVRVGDSWFTPPTSDGCLPGIRRGRLLDEGQLAERSITVAELRAADEVAVINSLRGWRKAVLID